MLTFKISKDKKSVILSDFDLNSERNHLDNYFKKKSKKADFNILVDRGIWDGMDSFFKDNSIKIGLWKEIYNFADQYGYEVKIEEIEKFLNLSFSKENYQKYVSELLDGVVDEFGEPLVPRDYQSEAAYRAIKYKFCSQELATSAGKTLIFYIFTSFLRDAGKINKNSKALMIVPKAGLVNQTAKAFNHFLKKGKTPFKMCLIGGNNKFDQKTFDESDLIIATYQSLNHWPKERFNSIYCIDVDEVHKSRGEVIKKVIEYCSNWQYMLGLSGTVKLDEKYSDYFRMLETIGPLVLTLSAKHLIDKKYSPNIKIKQVKLSYDESSEYLKKYWDLKANGASMYSNKRDFGGDMFELEKQFIYSSKERLEFISELAKKLNSNTLVLFSNIKDEYGKKIHEEIKKWNKNTYYIDGETDTDLRDEYKAIMENSDQITILTFVDSIVKINQYSRVPLANGSYKLAKDIQKDDDVLDSWININRIR